MFAAPPITETEVYAELPAEYLDVAGNEWAAGQPGSPNHPVVEGPSFDKDGNLYIVEITSGRIFRISPDRDVTLVAEYDGWPNGLKIHRDGRIFIADYKNGVMLLDPVNGKVEPYLVRANLERFKAINDLAFADNGDLYFTDQGLTGLQDPSGRVFRVRADGEVSCVIDNAPSPNGLVMSADGSTLFVAMTRANAVWRVPFLRDGTATKVGTFIQLSGGGGPDGLALTDKGGLVVAHVGLGTVWIFDPVGRPIEQVRSCRGMLTTNIAFGGPDRHQIYITESETSTVLVAQTSVAGRPMFSHQE